MALSSEEIAADLVWRYTERIRSGEAEALSEPELEQLLGVLRSVPATVEALELTDEARQAAVRKHIEQLAAEAQPARAPLPASPTPAPLAERLVPAWRFRAACAMAGLLALAVATVGFWHRPPAHTVVRRMVVPRDIRGVDAMDELQAHELLPLMVHNQLKPKQEKDLMGHMLVCPGCFNQYVALKQHVKDVARVGTQMAVLARRESGGRL